MNGQATSRWRDVPGKTGADESGDGHITRRYNHLRLTEHILLSICENQHLVTRVRYRTESVRRPPIQYTICVVYGTPRSEYSVLGEELHGVGFGRRDVNMAVEAYGGRSAQKIDHTRKVLDDHGSHGHSDLPWGVPLPSLD